MSKISRNEFMSITGAGVLGLAFVPAGALSNIPEKEYNDMYGLIGKITAKAGKRDLLIGILIEGASDMPGCLSYIISKDAENERVIWVTEVWESKESHRASLELPSVQEAMSKGRPLIENLEDQIEMEPVGGHGLVSADTE